MSEFDYEEDDDLDEYEFGETYFIHCEYCERDVEHSSDTGEPIISEGCSDFNCPLLSPSREGGDPEPLNFSE